MAGADGDRAATGEAPVNHSRRPFADLGIAVGLCIALFLLAMVFVLPEKSLGATVFVTIIFGLGIVAVVLLYLLFTKGGPARPRRHHLIGLSATIVLCGVGLAMSRGLVPTSLTFWLLYATLTALPVVVAGFMPNGPARGLPEIQG